MGFALRQVHYGQRPPLLPVLHVQTVNIAGCRYITSAIEQLSAYASFAPATVLLCLVGKLTGCQCSPRVCLEVLERATDQLAANAMDNHIVNLPAGHLVRLVSWILWVVCFHLRMSPVLLVLSGCLSS